LGGGNEHKPASGTVFLTRKVWFASLISEKKKRKNTPLLSPDEHFPNGGEDN